MNAIELLEIISTGETSKVQFKQELPHRDSVAQEIVAMSNSLGGVILLGVKDVTVSYRDWETDRKSTRLNSSHSAKSRMPSSA